MRQRFSFSLLTVPLFAFVALTFMSLTFGGCSEGASDDPSVMGQPKITSAGSHRFLIEGEGENCEENGGGWDCTWEDADGTQCTYGLNADGVLLYQECTGPWGDYNCQNGGTSIVCIYENDGAQCEDTWSLDYELVDTTCDFGSRAPDESCEEQEDGSSICEWSDDYFSCTYSVAADGSLISQICTDGSMTYSCLPEGELVRCTMSVPGQEDCVDTWSANGEPLEIVCEGVVIDDDDQRPPQETEECEEQEDGTYVCTYLNGEDDCVIVLDANGQPLSQVCNYDEFVYSCIATGVGDIVECDLSEDGVVLCTDVWTYAGEPIEQNCEQYIDFADQSEPEPECEECECEHRP